MTAELSQMERDVIDPHVAFAELSKIMLGAEPLNVTLERIAELARATRRRRSTRRRNLGIYTRLELRGPDTHCPIRGWEPRH
jgi:hypothetical protein